MRRVAALLTLAACSPAPPVANVPPVADAGFDQVAAVPDTVTLDGSRSHDPDAPGAALTYAWRMIAAPAGSTPELLGGATARPSFVADREGTYLFWLTVNDGGAESVPDVVAVSALPYLAVARVVPADQAAGVSPASPVLIELSESVQADTVNAGSIMLTASAGLVVGGVSVDDGNRVVIFTPLAALAPQTRYTLFVGYGVRSLRGLSLAIPFESDFTTTAGADTDPPLVIEILPADGATNVAFGAAVRVTFSEPVTRAGALAAFTLTGPAGVVAGAVAFSSADMRMTFTPDAPLALGATYTIDLAAGVTDVDGNPTAAATRQSFTTASAADTARPTVMTLDPAPGFTDVGVQARVIATFSEAIEPGSAAAATFIVADSAGQVAGAYAYSVGNTVVTFTPAAALTYDKLYTVTLTTGITDRAGLALDGNGAGDNWTSSFRTVARTQNLDHFRVEAAPALLDAGSATSVTLKAEDINGILILGYDHVASILLEHTGSAAGTTWSGSGVTDNPDGSGSLSGGQFANGVAVVYLTNTLAEGPVPLTVTEQDTVVTALRRSGSTAATGTSPRWRPGPLDRFVVTLDDPTTRAAGEDVRVIVTAQDAFGNVITAYQNSAYLTLDQSGSAAGKSWENSTYLAFQGSADGNGDNALTASSFASGVTSFTLVNTVAEGPVVIQVTENDSGNSVSGASAGITWNPGPLDHFRVEAAPVLLTVGSATTVTITAEDRHANVIGSYVNVQPNELTQNAGSTGVAWSGPCVTDGGDGTASLGNCWTAGVAVVQLVNTQAEGPVRISATDPQGPRTGNTGLSGTNVTWSPGGIDHFEIEASPLSLPAGSATTVTLTAVDLYGNPVANYNPSAPIDVTVGCGGACAGSFTFAGTDVTDNVNTATIADTALFDNLGRFAFTVADSANDTGVSITAAEQMAGPSGTTSVGVTWNSSSCSPPTAVPQVSGVTGCSVQLAGSASFNGGFPPLTYAWTFLSVPTGSSVTNASLTPSAAAPSPSFVADLPGDYILKLAVTNACGSNHNDFLGAPYAMSVAAGDVLINEVVTQPRSDRNGSGGISNSDEFVELYNASGCVRTLTGWTLAFADGNNSSYVFGTPLNGRILFNANAVAYFPPGGFLVLLDPDGSANNSLANDVYIALSADTNVVIDDVELGDDPEIDGNGDGAPDGTAAGGASTSPADECVSRSPNGADTNNDVNDFCRCVCTYGAVTDTANCSC